MTEELLGITGATGAVGGRVARRIAGLGLPQRLIVRHAVDAPTLEGAEVAEARDYGDRTSFEAAASGVTTLFLVSAREHPERLAQHRTAVEGAASAGVERIVYLSFLAAAPEATFTFARDHFHTEELIRQSGLAFTFLRSSLYLDLMPWIATAEGVIAGPAGSGRVAPVARDDVADVVVAVLTTRRHDGATYDNTGPSATTLAHMAAELTRASGRQVTYRDETLEEAWASRRPCGAPDWMIEGWITTYLAVAKGEMDVVSDTVPRLAGHPAQTFSEFLGEHPESFGHLLPQR